MLALLGILAIAIAFAAVQVAAGNRRGAPRRALERAKPTAIASLQQGDLTKITGVIAPRAPMLMSAIEQQTCIGYSTAVEAASEEHGWRSVLTSAACASFFVTDETGTAVVKGNIEIAADPEIGWATPPPSLFPPKEDNDPLVWLSPHRGGRTRYREILLKPGDRVSVLGRAKMEIDPAGRSSFRDPPMLNHMTGTEDAPVIVAHDVITLG